MGLITKNREIAKGVFLNTYSKIEWTEIKGDLAVINVKEWLNQDTRIEDYENDFRNYSVRILLNEPITITNKHMQEFLYDLLKDYILKIDPNANIEDA